MKLNDQELPPLTNVAINSNPQLYWTESLPTGFQLEGALYEKEFDVGSFFCCCLIPSSLEINPVWFIFTLLFVTRIWPSAIDQFPETLLTEIYWNAPSPFDIVYVTVPDAFTPPVLSHPSSDILAFLRGFIVLVSKNCLRIYLWC